MLVGHKLDVVRRNVKKMIVLMASSILWLLKLLSKQLVMIQTRFLLLFVIYD